MREWLRVGPSRAIETIYRGRHYRSRLEARWAVFFTALGLPFRYEPEGFSLAPCAFDAEDERSGGTGECAWCAETPDALAYLPDFFLPTVAGGVWIEVKGVLASGRDEQRAELLAHRLGVQTGQRVILVVGDCSADDAAYEATICWPGWDRPYFWCVCPTCGEVGIEFEGRGCRVACRRRCKHNGSDRGHSADAPAIVQALEAASMARFGT